MRELLSWLPPLKKEGCYRDIWLAVPCMKVPWEISTHHLRVLIILMMKMMIWRCLVLECLRDSGEKKITQ